MSLFNGLLSEGHGSELKCPSCRRSDTLRKSTQVGLLEKRILPFFLLRPYKCDNCGSRFYSLSINNVGAKSLRRATEEFSTTFLSAQDDRDFQQLVSEIREAERRMGLSEPEEKTKRNGKKTQGLEE